MPRSTRLNLTDVPQHIIRRGNNRQANYRELVRSELALKEIGEIRDTVNKGWPWAASD
jgi:hypothetical protein